MNKLYRKIITVYECSFCDRRYNIQKRCSQHEFTCYKNPNRHCNSCNDTGVELLDSFGFNFGVTPGGIEKYCWSCMIAKKAGGKSYIEKLLASPNQE